MKTNAVTKLYEWKRNTDRTTIAIKRMAAIRRRFSTQVLKSPRSLISLDLPDIWGSSADTLIGSPPLSCFKEQDAAVIDGKLIAEEIKSTIATEVRKMKQCVGKIPGLAVILVGQRWDSKTYVRNKIAACEETGIRSLTTEFPEECSEDDVLKAVLRFNEDPSIHGILVQLPLPQHMDEAKISNVLSLEKDVDGFHPLHMGNLAMTGKEPMFIPCTPKACVELLIRHGVEIAGKNAVVIGRSNIAGLPTSLLLQRHHATVSIIHEFTNAPEQITKEADIVVTAAGVPNLVRGSWLKPGAVVIDVGTCPVEDCNSENGYRIMGDVCYEEAVKVASALTPVPGGVGPMTIAMLLSNTLDSAKRKYNLF